jgi:hypothetical protein
MRAWWSVRETRDAALVREAETVDAVDHVHVQIKEGMTSWITVERMLNQSFRDLGLHPERTRDFLDLRAFLDAGGPTEIL